jgi:hypothetical protein
MLRFVKQTCYVIEWKRNQRFLMSVPIFLILDSSLDMNWFKDFAKKWWIHWICLCNETRSKLCQESRKLVFLSILPSSLKWSWNPQLICESSESETWRDREILRFGDFLELSLYRWISLLLLRKWIKEGQDCGHDNGNRRNVAYQRSHSVWACAVWRQRTFSPALFFTSASQGHPSRMT